MSSIDDILRGQLPAELLTRLNQVINPATYTDSSAAPGDAAANTVSGRSSIGAGQTAAIITNSLVRANSVVMVTFEDADATGSAKPLKCVPAAGTFTVTLQAAATGTTKFRWFVVI